MEQEDTILIQNILNGNQIAQEKLYNKYKKSVKNFLICKYSVYYDLEDDVSEIMIKVFMNLNSFDETKSKFRSWVFSIAKNYMIDKWRSNSCTATLVSSTGTFTTSADCVFNASNTSSTGFISTNANSIAFTSSGCFSTSNTAFETCNSINYISTQLSPQDFTLLDMKYIQGYDYNEIGKEFNVTSSTISNRVNYIKTKLKKNNTEIMYD
jgi:RNA polymerase sigma factor (sigma-70 family)